MARKHSLTAIGSMTPERAPAKNAESRADYARRGASRSMGLSLEEMAEHSMRVLDGDAIVSLDPDVLDESPFRDRSGDDADFAEFVEAIRSAGQSSPILVRPNAESPGRFIIVYGHRRTRAARHLGLKVRAVIKALDDIEQQVIVQGQENTARLNQSFIEKALYAEQLLDHGIGKDVIKKALTIDDTLLSRMLSVVEHVPAAVIEALVPAVGVGRDRWEELKKLVLHPEQSALAVEKVQTAAFQVLPPSDQFSSLCAALKRPNKRKSSAGKGRSRDWSIGNDSVAVSAKPAPKAYTLSIKASNAPQFGEFLSTRLEGLYEEFLKSQRN